MALHAEPPGIRPGDFDFTAYAKWAGFREYEDELGAGGLHPVLGPIMDAVRERLKQHFKDRDEELRASVIEEWKQEAVYPYASNATTEIERVERELFDVVVSTAASAVNASSDQANRRLSLRLLREAIEQSPSSLRRVLQEVLDLPPEVLQKLDRLLDRTSLTSIIALGKVVADRLGFLAALRELVFDPKTKRDA